MTNHVRVYLSHFGYDGFSFMPCEVCGGQANDIHHIIYRSKFGKNRKDEQDHIANLMALCRICHDKAHNEILSKDYLKEVHENFML